MMDMFGNKDKPKVRADRKPDLKVVRDRTESRGKHDHDSGYNPTMGSTYEARHRSKTERGE